jgi:nickel transport protein
MAHGVGYRQLAQGPVAFEFYYSTGEVMSYMDVKVFSPEDEKYAYQSGRTDGKGRFAFVPDAPGVWIVDVRDDQGHRAEARIEIGTEAQNSAGTASVPLAGSSMPEGSEQVIRAALGVSLLFNLAAGIVLYRRIPRMRGGEV